MANSAEIIARNSRIVVLQMIREQKERLFGKFQDKANKADKEKAWQEIAERAHKLGVYPETRNGAYLRDTTWQNWRKRFVEKREKKIAFEKSGGRKIDFDEADLIVADILEGREDHPRFRDRSFHLNSNSNSASNNFEDFLEIDIKEEEPYSHVHRVGSNDDDENLVSLDEDCNEEDYEDESEGLVAYHPRGKSVNASSMEFDRDREGSISPTHENAEATTTAIPSSSHTKVHNISNANKSVTQFRIKNLESNKNTVVRRYSSKRKLRFLNTDNKQESENNGESEEWYLKEKKLHLEVELMELEKYKRMLEILKLERSLGLPPSEITQEVAGSRDVQNLPL